jgi:hypothetical protein
MNRMVQTADKLHSGLPTVNVLEALHILHHLLFSHQHSTFRADLVPENLHCI